MNKKEKIIKIIQGADVSQEIKDELLALADKNDVSEATIEEMQEVLDGKALEIVQEITDIVAEQAVDEFNQGMDGLEKDVDDFKDELDAKADEIDLQETRQAIQEQH